jgi:hypothetical protein
MISLELTLEEAQELANVLHEYLSELRAEISATDSHDFKEQLRNEKRELIDIQAKLNALLPTPA